MREAAVLEQPEKRYDSPHSTHTYSSISSSSTQQQQPLRGCLAHTIT